MNGSIRDRFLKEHELSLEDLEKVTGGDPEFAGYSFDCPNCKHRAYAILEDGNYVSDLNCDQCGWFIYGMLTKDEADKMFH